MGGLLNWILVFILLGGSYVWFCFGGRRVGGGVVYVFN